MPMSKVPWHVMKDPLGTTYWPFSQGRDGARTPMQWTADKNAGFTTGTPWLPVDRSHAVRNVAEQDADPRSLLNWYRRLIRLRAEQPALQTGSYRAIEGAPTGVFGYARASERDTLAVLLNFTPREATFRLEPDPSRAGGHRTLLSNYEDVPSERTGTADLRLRPHEVLILAIDD